MYDIERTGEIIKGLRKQREKTQECVANEMGINIKTYRAIEKGIRGGSVDTLCLIAEYFGCTLDYLIYGICGDNEINVILNPLDVSKRNKVLEIVKDIVDAIVN